MKYPTSVYRRAFLAVAPLLFTAFLMVPAWAQTSPSGEVATEPAKPADEQAVKPAAQPAVTPFVHDVEGLTIGMTADEVKAKLGKPESADKTGMYYDRKNASDVQLSFAPDGKVNTIAFMYSGKDEAPDIAKIFGPDYKFEAAPDGRIYEKVRYPNVGYSITYSRIKLSDGYMTTVTLHKLFKGSDK